jgi:hypothetical protein
MESFDHERFMRRAIALTANCPRLPFGALIVCVDTGEVVAEGWNKSAVNPTWHGQIDILAEEVVRRSPGWACTIIGGLLGNSLINLTSQDINTYEKVNSLLTQINAQPRSAEREALAVALNNLLAFYSGEDGA